MCLSFRLSATHHWSLIIFEFQDLLWWALVRNWHKDLDTYICPKINYRSHHFIIKINKTYTINKVRNWLFQQLLLTVTLAFWFPPAQWPPTWQSVLKDIWKDSGYFLPHRQSNMFPRFCLRRHKVPSPPQCCQIHRSSHIYKCHLYFSFQFKWWTIPKFAYLRKTN